jgi:hypothetical protein
MVVGREHDLTFDEISGTVLKFTKPSKAAEVVGEVLGIQKTNTAVY